mmetsp:Transcript_19143/g.45099  ORF Transcript_19143/g.45099 Transcript_19143/m.45099 type:complete len:302 (+) Transcript_19143:404-1309(+)
MASEQLCLPTPQSLPVGKDLVTNNGHLALPGLNLHSLQRQFSPWEIPEEAAHGCALGRAVAFLTILHASKVPELVRPANCHVEKIVHLCKRRQQECAPDLPLQPLANDVDANTVRIVPLHVWRHGVACIPFGAPVRLVVRNFALVEVHIALFTVPDHHGAPDSVLRSHPIRCHATAIHDKTILCKAVVGLPAELVKHRATIIMVSVPQPDVVQHHVVAVDLHHGVCTNNGAPSIRKRAHTCEDVRDQARTVGKAVLLMQLRAPEQQWLCRGFTLGCASLEQQACNPHFPEAAVHLDGRPSM